MSEKKPLVLGSALSVSTWPWSMRERRRGKEMKGKKGHRIARTHAASSERAKEDAPRRLKHTHPAPFPFSWMCWWMPVGPTSPSALFFLKFFFFFWRQIFPFLFYFINWHLTNFVLCVLLISSRLLLLGLWFFVNQTAQNFRNKQIAELGKHDEFVWMMNQTGFSRNVSGFQSPSALNV